MFIFFIWFGLICCGVANGIIFDHVNTPERYYYMVVSSAVAVILLVVHRIYTQDWCKLKKRTKKNEKVEHHLEIFGISAMLSGPLFTASVLSAHTGDTSWGFFVGNTTAFVLICIATVRESNYIWNLLAVRIGSLIFCNDLFYFCLSLAFYIWKFTLII